MRKRKIERRLGITIVEVIISFSIALILIMALYMIVYWGTNYNPVNEKIMSINNILTYIQADMVNNTTRYFDYDSNTGRMFPKGNIDSIIMARLQEGRYRLDFIKSIKVASFENEIKPTGGRFDNIYRVTIIVEWQHKNQIKKYDAQIIVSSYDYKKIMANQRPNETTLTLRLPQTFVNTIYQTTITRP